MAVRLRSHRELLAYQRAIDAAMEIFWLSRQFPVEERYSLTDQIRRSSRSVCANMAEAWRKRRYKGAFISKLSDAEGEAAETQTWLEFAVKCAYLDREVALPLYHAYDEVIRLLVAMIVSPEKWVIAQADTAAEEAEPYGEPF